MRSTVLPLWMLRIIVDIDLYALAIIHVSPKSVLNSFNVGVHRIARNLYAMSHTACDIPNKLRGSGESALSTFERRNQFRLGINRAIRPDIAVRWVIVYP